MFSIGYNFTTYNIKEMLRYSSHLVNLVTQLGLANYLHFYPTKQLCFKC